MIPKNRPGAKNALFCPKDSALAKQQTCMRANSLSKTILRNSISRWNHKGQMRKSRRSVVGATLQDPAYFGPGGMRRTFHYLAELVRRGLVVASRPARLAVHQTIGANADVNHRLAQATVLLALAIRLRLFTLGTAILRGTGSGAHG